MNINKDEKIIEFYAAAYNQKSRLRIEGDRKVIEIIKEKAFETALKSCYVYATLLHDESFQFANTNNILTLKSDDYGLKATIKFTDENEYNRISKLIEEMDLKEASFKASTNDYSEEIENDITYRYINTIKEIIDVSLVTVGRYANTIILKRDDNTNNKNLDMVEKNKVEETKKEIVNEDVSGNTKKIEVINENIVVDEKIEKIKKVINENIVVDEKIEKIKELINEDKTKEVVNEDKKVEQVEEKEIVNTASTQENKNNIKKENKKMNKTYLELVREAIDNGSSILLERSGEATNEVTTTVAANGIAKAVGQLSIAPKNTIWEKLGCDYHKNAQGTIMLPYKSAAIGQKVAELAALTKDSITVNGNLLTPQRFGYTFEYSVETLAAAGDSFINKLIEDGQKAAYRKFETALFEKLVAGATEISGATDISVDSFNELEGAVESDGDITFISGKKTFYKAKSTVVDAGSGQFLATKTGKNEGEVLGTDYLFSTNMITSGDTEYVVAADFAEGVAIADWNQTEVIVDKYSRAKEGVVQITVNVLMDSALRNPFVVVKSADLDVSA